MDSFFPVAYAPIPVRTVPLLNIQMDPFRFVGALAFAGATIYIVMQIKNKYSIPSHFYDIISNPVTNKMLARKDGKTVPYPQEAEAPHFGIEDALNTLKSEWDDKEPHRFTDPIPPPLKKQGVQKNIYM